MDRIHVGMKLNIKRRDGRIVETSVIGMDAKLRSITVHWIEDGETKGKLMEFDSLVELNPQLLDNNNNATAPGEKRKNLRAMYYLQREYDGEREMNLQLKAEFQRRDRIYESIIEKVIADNVIDVDNNPTVPDENRYNLRNLMQGQSKEGQSKRRNRGDNVDNKKVAVVEPELSTSESESENEEIERPRAKKAKGKSKHRRVVRTMSDSYSSDDYDSDWLPSKRGNGFAPNKNRGKPKTKH